MTSSSPSIGTSNKIRMLSREKLDQYNNLKMVQSITVNGIPRLIREMDVEFKSGPMDLAMMAIGKTALLMDMVD